MRARELPQRPNVATVDLGIGVSHAQRGFPEESKLGLGFERDRDDHPINPLVPADDVDVLDPERGVLREPALKPNEIALGRSQEHRPRDQDPLLPPWRDQHVGQAVCVDAVGEERVVGWFQG